MTGRISFIGRQLLAAKIGNHKLRDSLKIIPIALAEYQKDHFDYELMAKDKRNKHRLEIQEYLENDCIRLLELVKGFIRRFGPKLTVGQAAFENIKKYYEFEHLGEKTDETLRTYFYGGRVECIRGLGHFTGRYKLYDVNSMYPFVMAYYKHPIGADLVKRVKGGITENTCFVEVKCNNYGAFPAYDDETGALTFTKPHGVFRVSIYEYEVAEELGLIDHSRILSVIDCERRSTFHDAIMPLYKEREKWKGIIRDLKKRSDHESLTEYWEAKLQDLLVKFVLNSGYGKFAQNPRKFTECFIRERDYKLPPPTGFEECRGPKFYNDLYEIWEKPALRRRYNNVATAASITGAARSILLRAMYNAIDPIYADTDSLICRELHNTELDPKKLGAWDLEDEFDEVVIAGKKLYACRTWTNTPNGQEPRDKVRSKGLSDMTFEEIASLVGGQTIRKTRKGVTIAKNGNQFYLTREAKATVDVRTKPFDIFGRAYYSEDARLGNG